MPAKADDDEKKADSKATTTPTTASMPGAIALQIIAPNGMGGGRSHTQDSAGGPLGEWAKKFTSFGCIACWSLFLIGVNAAVAGMALYYVYGQDSALDCIGHLWSISFSYITWLRVMGFTYIGGLMVAIFLIFLHGWFSTVCTSKSAVLWGYLFYAFQLAWAIIGAVLYWTTVVDNCQNGGAIQAFALAIFITESVVAICLALGREAVYASA